MATQLELWIFDPRIAAWELSLSGDEEDIDIDDLEKRGDEIVKSRSLYPMNSSTGTGMVNGWKYEIRKTEKQELGGRRDMIPQLELWIYDPRIAAWEQYNTGTDIAHNDFVKTGQRLIEGKQGWQYEVREVARTSVCLSNFKVEQFNDDELFVRNGDISIRIS